MILWLCGVHHSLREKTETCFVASAFLCVCCIASPWYSFYTQRGLPLGSCLLERAAWESCSYYVRGFPFRKQMSLQICTTRPLGECVASRRAHTSRYFHCSHWGLLDLSEPQPSSSSNMAPDRLLQPVGWEKWWRGMIPVQVGGWWFSYVFSFDFKISSLWGTCSQWGL